MHTTHKLESLSVVLVAGLLASACGGAKPAEVVSPSPPPPAATAEARETPAQAASSGSVEISPDIRKACGLSDADAYFPFDSSRLEKQDITPLNSLATCFETGGLKGHSMKLLGRADPRGPSDYNVTLGQARADSVEGYLARRGLDKAKMGTTSRGAMDATGTDEAGWKRDRRVDVVLP